MKKAVSFLLALVVLCSMSIPGLADDGDKVAELILIAKNTFQISDDVFVFENYSKSEQDGLTAAYHLWWTTRQEDEYAMRQDSISVNIREDGVIESYRYHKDTDYSDDRQLPKHSKEEAKAAADAFSAKVNGYRAAQVRVSEITDADRYSNSYTVQYTRYANDIPVMGNGIDISIDAQTLEPIAYSANWSDVTFADPAGAIDADAAKAAYKEKLGYELTYEFFYRDKKEVPLLVYRPKYSEPAYIDAMTGEVFRPSLHAFATFDAAVAKSEDASGGGSNLEGARLSEEEQAFVAEVEQMITRQQAETIARGIKEFEIGSDFTDDSYRVSKGYDDQYIVRISFIKPEKDGKGEQSTKQVSIDAKTRQVIAYYNYDWPQMIKSSYNPTVSGADAKKTAEAFLNAHYAEQLAQTLPENTLAPQEDNTSFVYDRMVNDIRVIGNGINISVDGETGKISSFNLRWTTQSFPSAAGVKSPDDVYAAALAEYAPAYHVQTVYDETANAAKTESHLVYLVKSENSYDANTLEVIDYNGYPVNTQTPAYSDISGHWSETAANRLLEIGVYFPGGELIPDKAVTQSEFLQLVAQVVNGRSSFSTDTELLRYFINNGVLTREEVHPTQAVSRIEGVKYLLNAMGFKKSAVIPGIYNCPFADITAAPDTGYASIAGGLGLVSTAGDTFNPNNTLTRAQALTMLFNYLNK